MTEKQRVFMLSEPTLSTSLMCIKGGTLKQSNKALASYDVIDIAADPDPTVKGWTFDVQANNHRRGLTFKALYWDGVDIPTLAHEVTHLVMHIFVDRGIPISCDNEEIFAYHVGYWMQCIMEEIKVTELP